MQIIQDLESYVYAAASKDPSPGGGSVAAASGALGASLLSMVQNFTLGRKKYIAVEDEVLTLQTKTTQYIDELMVLAKKDILAFDKVSAAYALPKETIKEKEIRSNAIATACEAALNVPVTCIAILLRIMGQIERIAEIGNTNLDSDTAGATILSHASLETAYYCAYANFPFIKNEELLQTIKEKINTSLKRSLQSKEKTLSIVNQRMKV